MRNDSLFLAGIPLVTLVPTSPTTLVASIVGQQVEFQSKWEWARENPLTAFGIFVAVLVVAVVIREVRK